MKVRTDAKQDSVQTQVVGSTQYVRLYLHEAEGTEEIAQDEEATSHIWYEYDFKEISAPVEILDIDAIKASPEDYLDYKPVAPTTLEDLQEALMALQQIVLGDAE